MAEYTAISWCDHTVNFWWGCEKVSPACANCYAEREDARWHIRTYRQTGNWEGFSEGVHGKGMHWGPDAPRLLRAERARQEAFRYQRRAVKEGRRFRVFTNSMSDFFEDRSDLDAARLEALDVIRQTPNLDWLILTKRPESVLGLLSKADDDCFVGTGEQVRLDLGDWIHAWLIGAPPANVWLGTTAEDQERADQRIPALLQAPAAVRFLSCEPLLGPLSFRWESWAHKATGETYRQYLERNGRIDQYEALRKFDWVIVGGESGPKARPMHPDWVRLLRDQCAEAGVPFHFKQWGEWSPEGPLDTRIQCAIDYRGRTAKGGLRQNFPPAASSADIWHHLYRVGKARAGRLLDGIEHNAFPTVEGVTG